MPPSLFGFYLIFCVVNFKNRWFSRGSVWYIGDYIRWYTKGAPSEQCAEAVHRQMGTLSLLGAGLPEYFDGLDYCGIVKHDQVSS